MIANGKITANANSASSGYYDFTLSQKGYNICLLNSLLNFLSQLNSENSFWALKKMGDVSVVPFL